MRLVTTETNYSDLSHMGGKRAMANGVKFGRKPKLSDYQRQEVVRAAISTKPVAIATVISLTMRRRVGIVLFPIYEFITRSSSRVIAGSPDAPAPKCSRHSADQPGTNGSSGMLPTSSAGGRCLSDRTKSARGMGRPLCAAKAVGTVAYRFQKGGNEAHNCQELISGHVVAGIRSQWSYLSGRFDLLGFGRRNLRRDP
jgi:hypothetical protein